MNSVRSFLVGTVVFLICLAASQPQVAWGQRPLGIDVSSYQDTPNWTDVKTAGISFAWAKATEGTFYIDADFTYNEANAKAAGVYIGAYHFAHPDDDPNITGSDSADTEASYFWSEAGSYITSGGYYLMPALDYETAPTTINQAESASWVNEWCQDIVNYAAANGTVVKPVVYTYTSFADDWLTSANTEWPLWMASPNGDSAQTGAPSSTSPWSTWTFWQYGQADVSGITTGVVDEDVFNGTAATLASTMVIGTGTPPVIQTVHWDPTATHGTNGGGTGSWNGTAVDWWASGNSNIVWTDGDSAVFGGTAGTVTLNGDLSADAITFNTPGYVISGSDTLDLGGAGTIVVPAGAPTYIECVLTGVGYTISGGGVLVLNNSGNDNASPLTVTGPNTCLVIANSHDDGADSLAVNLVNGGILQNNDATSGDVFLNAESALVMGTGGGILDNPNASLTFTGNIVGSGSLTFTGVSGYTLTFGTPTYTANTYSGGTIVDGPGTLALSGTGTLGSTSGPLTVNGGVLNLGATSQAAGTVTITGGTIESGTLTGSSYAGQGGSISAVLAGSASLTKTTTNTLTLSGLNTFSGTTTISGGTLQISADDNLGTAPGSATVNKINLSGGGNLRAAGNFTLNANRGITLGSGGGVIQAASGDTLSYGGVITGSGAFSSGASVTVGYGTVILSGANNYTGGTTIACGTLTLGANGTLPSGRSLTIAAADSVGGTLNMNGYSQTIGPLASSTGIGGTGTDTPTIDLTGALTIIQTNVNTTFSGVIASAGGNLTKTGSATLTLAGANTYTGSTTISAGTLVLAATGSINSTASINIAAGATLDVSAQASYALGGSTSVSASGTASPATINGGTSVNLGSRPITLTYDGSDPALTISQGTLSLNGNAFTVNGSVLPRGVYTLIQQTSGNITSAGSYTVSGTAIPSSGAVAAISVSGGSVLLTITDNTTTALGALSPTTYGQPVSLVATVAPPPSGGTVQFYDNSAALGAPANVTSGMASYSTSLLPVGSNAITASFSGSPYYNPSSTTGASIQEVNPAPLTITASAQSKVYGTVLNFGAGSTNFTPAGLQNSETVGSVTLTVSSNGGAASAPVGTYTITPSLATGGTFNPSNYTIAYNPSTLTVTLPSNTIPVTITSITVQPDGSVLMNFSGTPGYVYTIEAATNMNPPIDWTPISTNAADTNGDFSFDDEGVTNFTTRYYQTTTVQQ